MLGATLKLLEKSKDISLETAMANDGTLFGPMTVEEKPKFTLRDLVSEFPEHQTDWSIPEAFVCLVLSAAFADGKVTAEEQEEIQAIAHRSRILKSLEQNELAEINAKVLKRREDRPEWMAEACEALPRDMHLSVFAHCLDITMADGSLVSAEAEYLEQLISTFPLSQDDVQVIAKVISVKKQILMALRSLNLFPAH